MHTTFTPIEKKDQSILHTWLNIDFVSRWYERRKFVYKDVEAILSGRSEKVRYRVRPYLVHIDSTPIGYVHIFKIGEYPDYAQCVEVGDGVFGIDMFIGEKKYRYRGLGKDILDTFLKSYAFRTDGVSACLAGPSPQDMPMRRVYEKAGFSYLRTVECENLVDQEYLMIRKRKNETVVYHFTEKV